MKKIIAGLLAAVALLSAAPAQADRDNMIPNADCPPYSPCMQSYDQGQYATLQGYHELVRSAMQTRSWRPTVASAPLI